MCFFLNSCITYAEKEIIYVPEDYVGVIAIIFDQSRGEPKKFIDDSRIYRISDKGILLSQFEIPEVNSYLNQKVYYVDDANNILEEIHKIPSSKLEKDSINKIYKLDMFNMSVKDRRTAKENDYIRCVYFSVGKIENRDSLNKASHMKMEKFMRKLGSP